MNLLAAFELLLDTRSVTAAAARAGVTQSAMSRTLARLRDAFDDPLFVRTRAGMEPTATALALADRTRATLDAARSLFATRARFDPRTAQRDLLLAATDVGSLVVVPPLVHHLRREAPNVRVIAVPLPASPADALEAGTVDVAIAFGAQPRPGLRSQQLFEDDLVCTARKGHAAFDKRLTLARYLELEHLSVTPAAHAPDAIDRALARDGKQRRVAVRTTHFLMAPALLRTDDLVLTTGRRVAAQLSQLASLDIATAPVDIGPLRIAQLWHERHDRDPAHAWFRAQIARVARGV